MAKRILKGIQKKTEGQFSAETGYMYLIHESGDTGNTRGYIQLDGRKYGNTKKLLTYESAQTITQQEKENVYATLGLNPITVYNGTDVPPASLGNNGDIYLQTVDMLRAPDVVYETDGTTGLLGHNQSSFANQWQLENLDLTEYKYVKAYFKASNTSDSDKYTPAVVVTVPLDSAAMGPTAYIGSTMTPLPFNRNREYLVSCAVDSTKTKFQVIHQNTLWDITASDANNTGRYCYKIEGWY